jgi:hypothetical protein
MATHPSRDRLPAHAALAISIIGIAFLALSAAEAKESVEQQRREITTMADQTLAQLY